MIQDNQFRDKSISTTGGWKEDERPSGSPRPSSPRAKSAAATTVAMTAAASASSTTTAVNRPQHRRSNSSIKDRRAAHQQSENLIGKYEHWSLILVLKCCFIGT